MRARFIAVAVACALLASACSSGGGSTKPSTSAKPTPQRVVSTTTARGALLTGKDLGDTFTAGHYRAPTRSLFCASVGAPTVAKETSAAHLVGAQYSSRDPEANLVEDIYLYRSAAAARAALTAVQGDMQCATGHTYNADGSTDIMAVGAATDYSTRLTADLAYGWSLRSLSLRGIQFAMVAKTALIMLKYTIGTKSDAGKLPDAFDLAGTAYDRVSR
ncbi:MAG: hypothetical protein QOG80_848 [Pseudonocardiales bacterium]|jgi:hypothetical protein|nr:hypothetical protein [Pseudonocardiales bacterium]